MKNKKRRHVSPLKRTRQILALLSLTAVTLLFVDFTGTAMRFSGWMARIQFIPALLAANTIVMLALVVLTLVFGRAYCSVICPLGIMQDIFARSGRTVRKNRYRYSPPKNILRYTFLIIMIVSMAAGTGVITALLAPYSAYGRIVSSFLAPVWDACNNLLVSLQSDDTYTFYPVDMRLRGWSAMAVAAITLIALVILAWRNGRTYCNTVCPVGTLLGIFSRWSLFRPVIDTSRCNGCGLCARNCKSACIDPKTHTIDNSRCVVCMDCIDKCSQGAISYRRRPLKINGKAAPAKYSAATTASAKDSAETDAGRRSFLAAAAVIAATSAAQARYRTVDGGLAAITDKKVPRRATRIIPPGAIGARHFGQHCISCQLCVSACPNSVLRPSQDPGTFMMPESSYENGYCRPECTRCTQVCPAGAILPLTPEEKSSVQIGHAVWIPENCLPKTEGIKCGNCARHCPTGAISMIPSVPGNNRSLKIPAIDTERCIGCGACEYLCPSRPFSAIYVEGHQRHRSI